MKKIMFNDKYGLTQAVLEGRKTMTRRSINFLVPAVNKLRINKNGVCEQLNHDATLWVTCSTQPKYKVGEVVAIAQSYKDIINEILIRDKYETDIATLVYKKSKGWNNKMFVASAQMVHHIRITDIKVERLQDISEEDCLKEGIYFYNCGIDCGYTANCLRHKYGKAEEAFAALIDKVSGKGTRESNPWVFAYTFKLVD